MGNQVPKKEVEAWKTKYNIPKDKVDVTFKAFSKQKDKNGMISRAKFIEIMTHEGGNDTAFAAAIFDSFDKDKSGSIDIREYMALMGVTFGGDIDEKLEASFQLFDEDGNGELSQEEVERMATMVFKSMLSRAGGGELTSKHKKEIKQIVKEIFKNVDKDGSGSLDKEEFKKGFKEHPEMCRFFKQF